MPIVSALPLLVLFHIILSSSPAWEEKNGYPKLAIPVVSEMGVRIPFPVGQAVRRPDGTVPPELVRVLAAWLSEEFNLPTVHSLPDIIFIPQSQLRAFRARDVPSDQWGSITSMGSEILAIYDAKNRTIILRDGWSGETPAELSELVHEMVHHVQSVTGKKFACEQEREALAFAAQQKWLEKFGGSLEADFEIDPFTLMVRTNCPY